MSGCLPRIRSSSRSVRLSPADGGPGGLPVAVPEHVDQILVGGFYVCCQQFGFHGHDEDAVWVFAGEEEADRFDDFCDGSRGAAVQVVHEHDQRPVLGGDEV